MNAYWIGVIILAAIYYMIVFPVYGPIIANKVDFDLADSWNKSKSDIFGAGPIIFINVGISFISFASYWIIPLVILYVITIPIRRWLKKRL